MLLYSGCIVLKYFGVDVKIGTENSRICIIKCDSKKCGNYNFMENNFQYLYETTL